jgi:hypothetical protein
MTTSVAAVPGHGDVFARRSGVQVCQAIGGKERNRKTEMRVDPLLSSSWSCLTNSQMQGSLCARYGSCARREEKAYSSFLPWDPLI